MLPIIKFWQMEDGVAAVEYGLLLALIVIATMAGMTLVGTVVRDVLYGGIAAKFPG